MSTSTKTLQATGVAAENALFPNPQFVIIDTATHTALDANYTPSNVNTQIARMLGLTLSYSAAPAISTLTVVDDTTVIWQCEISATGPFVFDFDFTKRPLRASIGKALHAKVGDPGSGIVATISWTGDTIQAT